MKPVPLWWRILSYVMAALFAICVALQYNDPDPIRWMAMYGATMIVAIVMPSKKRLIPLSYLIAAVSLVWAAVLFAGIWGKMGFSDLWLKMSEKGGAVEEGRECGGLTIVGVWSIASALFRSRRA